MNTKTKHKTEYQERISSLDLKYTFKLIPEEATFISPELRSAAQVWYGPVFDDKNFYYTAWSGSIFNPNHTQTVLVCRERKTGRVIYAKDCNEYNIDSSPNWRNEINTICRCRPFILDDTIYLTNMTISNVGPQLFAVNKQDGSLKWAIAYNTPQNTIPQSKPIAPYIIRRKTEQKKDFGEYALSNPNMRLSDMNPKAIKIKIDGKERKFVFVGVSSFQNAINFGIIMGNPLSNNENNFPIYTDQGYLFCIEDKEYEPEIKWKKSSCAPVLHVGDLIVKNAPDTSKDPFRPGTNIVKITSITSERNYFVNPYFVESPPNPAQPFTTPITATITVTPNGVTIPQPIWQNLGKNIYIDGDRTNTYTYQEAITFLTGKVGLHTIWSYITSEQINLAKQQVGNNNLLYFKYLESGALLSEPYDAMSLNYWGNSTWGEFVEVDITQNLVFWGTGQSHELPLDDVLYYTEPSRNFVSLKTPVLDAIDKYIEGTLSIKQLNAIKELFSEKIKNLALTVDDRSPRSRMSYTDSIIASYIFSKQAKCERKKIKAGETAFAVRTLNYDNFTFLASEFTLVYPANVVDGDVSSGVKLIQNGERYISSATKSGLTAIINITRFNNNVTFDDTNFEETGAKFTKLLYNGPSGLLGGSNYANDDVNHLLINCQLNAGWSAVERSSKGNFEIEVTDTGTIYPTDNSFLSAVDVKNQKIKWYYNMGNRAVAQVLAHNGVVFSEDGSGNLYINNAENGKLLWKYDGNSIGMYGGIANPDIHCDYVVWANNYPVAGVEVGSPGPNGAVFKINKKIMLTDCNSGCFDLKGKNFISWDIVPKNVIEPPPSLPVNGQVVYHNFYKCKGKMYLNATHYFDNGTFTQLRLRIKHCDKNTIIFSNKKCFNTDMTYLSIDRINSKNYELKYKNSNNENFIVSMKENINF